MTEAPCPSRFRDVAASWLGAALGPLFAIALDATPLAAIAAPDPNPPKTVQMKTLFGLMTPMRDGVKLASDAFMPTEAVRYPIILIRTPYIRIGHDDAQTERFFVAHGYAVVIQDTRGRGDSEGTFDFFFPEAQDGYDTIEWLAAQPWSNGRVCTLGISYMGTVQWLAAKERPPHLVCMAPSSPAGDFLQELPSAGGAFKMGWALKFLSDLTGHLAEGPSQGVVDWEKVYAHRPLITADEALGRSVPLYRTFLQHDTMDAYWRRIQLGPDDFAKIDIPVLTTTGWFDGDQIGALYDWRGYTGRPGGVRDAFLVIGPWTHAQSWDGGAERLGEFELGKDSIVDNMALRLAFFDRYLKQSADRFDAPPVRVFITGANVWRTFPAYPVPQARATRYFLSSAGRANTRAGDGQLSTAPTKGENADGFVYDPKTPVPFVTGSGDGRGVDRSAIEGRDDVLVYSTPPLTHSVQIVGNVGLEIYAASDAPDTDFVATITDVAPNGHALLLGPRGVGVIRARYRHGPSGKVELLTPNKPEAFRIDLGDIGHEFLPGHRIRIDLTSSAVPSINPNQNTGAPIATDTEWRIAHQKLLHGKLHPSALVLPVVEGSAAAAGPGRAP
ncbi:CocE/NonD family hydrolase [Phenylobacterium sp.]|uniref:CocE/NonD family hydrolase n=1 Tax=Phenylobacterium sp. TaxID=1871053 RepID=UPI0025F6DD1D|nr:CocE/NonD family hydrolase [Phenylobacterium sp.]